jgi:type II secretory pathway pseudopilin PulG
MRSRRDRGSGGFTLVEALLAAMILALAGVVIASTLGRAYGSLADARDSRRAAALLDEVLVKVDTIGPQRVQAEGLRSGAFEGADARFSWELDIASEAETDLYKVAASVSWRGSSGPRTLRAETLLYDPPNSRPSPPRWEDL